MVVLFAQILSDRGHRPMRPKAGSVITHLLGDGDGERLGLEPTTSARRAGNLDHEFLELHADDVGIGLLVAALDVGGMICDGPGM